MTDEEKSAEYADKICKGCNKIHCKIEDECFSHESTRLNYLDGLAEGKPKWYDLRKDPSNLPKNRENVLLYVKLHDKYEREVVLIGYRDYGDCLGEYCQDWGYIEPVCNCKYDFVDGEEVIAWCELPKFEG